MIHRWWSGPNPPAENHWTDDTLPAEITSWVDTHAWKCSDVRHRSNLVRWALLNMFGGIWLDCDTHIIADPPIYVRPTVAITSGRAAVWLLAAGEEALGRRPTAFWVAMMWACTHAAPSEDPSVCSGGALMRQVIATRAGHGFSLPSFTAPRWVVHRGDTMRRGPCGS